MSKLLVWTLSVFATVAGIMIVPNQQAAAQQRVNVRQRNQQTRIGNGVQNGNLTRREVVKLGVQQRRVAKAEQRMRQSGSGLTGKEKVKLEAMQDKTSQKIYQQKHDAQQSHH